MLWEVLFIVDRIYFIFIFLYYNRTPQNVPSSKVLVAAGLANYNDDTSGSESDPLDFNALAEEYLNPTLLKVLHKTKKMKKQKNKKKRTINHPYQTIQKNLKNKKTTQKMTNLSKQY